MNCIICVNKSDLAHLDNEYLSTLILAFTTLNVNHTTQPRKCQLHLAMIQANYVVYRKQCC